MPKERNWQEDWDHVESCRWAKTLVNPFPVQTLFGELRSDTEALAYWLQEYKQQEHQIAKVNCEHQSEKMQRVRLAGEATREKKRADMLQRKLDSIKDTLLSMQDEYKEACKLEGLEVINHVMHLLEVEP